MDKIKVYGERNSGTNYLEELLILNTSLEVIKLDAPKILTYPLKKIERVTDWLIKWKEPSVLGWKHGIPPVKAISKLTRKQSLKIISISKNPYSFLLSFHKRPYHFRERSANFNKFLMEPVSYLPRDNFQTKKDRNPILLWNEKNKSFLELKNKISCPFVQVKYEELIKNPETVYNRLINELKLQSSEIDFQNVNKSTKGDDSVFNDYQDYYLNEKWKDKLTVESINIINSFLDKDLMNELGYEIL